MAGRQPVSRKAAPRRAIVSIDKVGSWGRFEYWHKLECGHVEVRKRVAPAKVMACTGCVLAEVHEREVNERPPAVVDEVDWDVLASELAMSENEAAMLRVKVANYYGLPVDAVDVVLVDEDGQLQLNCAVVVLSAEEVLRITSSVAT